MGYYQRDVGIGRELAKKQRCKPKSKSKFLLKILMYSSLMVADLQRIELMLFICLKKRPVSKCRRCNRGRDGVAVAGTAIGSANRAPQQGRV